MASYILFPANSVTGTRSKTPGSLLSGGRWSIAQVVSTSKLSFVRSSLDSLGTKVSDMSVNAPKGLFPSEPEHYRGTKLKVAIIEAGLAGMSTAVELLDQGHEDYIDSMEGATLSGRQASAYICDAGEELVASRKKLAAAESPENTVSCPVTDEPSLA